MSDKQYRDAEVLRKETGIDAPMDAKSKTEHLKLSSNGLRGNVRSEMLDESTPNVSEDSYQIMKHFGMYQQDDRDTRSERRKAGLEKDYSFMVRTKVPGGVLTAEQYMILDDCATSYSKGSLRLTSRQTIQFHGVGKLKLQALVRDLEARLLTTYGACGDVVRNTMTCPVIDIDPRPEWAGREAFIDLARQITHRTLPRTTAYFDIFLDGEKRGDLERPIPLRNESEDLYGESYMPRKFKIGIASPEDNCIDIFTQDLGLAGILKDGVLTGYNVMVGGGLGFAHGNASTYPRLGTPVAFVHTSDILRAVDAVITIQRDHGNRLDRKQARLKYLVDNVGIDWFHAEMERRMSRPLAPGLDIVPEDWHYHDHLGWHAQKQPGLYYVGVFVENGRIIDRPGNQMKSVFRRIIEKFRPGVRITPQSNLVLSGISESHRTEIDMILRDAGLAVEVNGLLGELRRHEISCVSLPTCGLALAEAERALPQLIDKLEEMGYGNERISIRMSGCPNSCSRPVTSEIGIIGCAPGKYHIYTGGDFEGTRLNQVFKEKVPFAEVPLEIGKLIDRWRRERHANEPFGDWACRLGPEALRN